MSRVGVKTLLRQLCQYTWYNKNWYAYRLIHPKTRWFSWDDIICQFYIEIHDAHISISNNCISYIGLRCFSMEYRSHGIRICDVGYDLTLTEISHCIYTIRGYYEGCSIMVDPHINNYSIIRISGSTWQPIIYPKKCDPYEYLSLTILKLRELRIQD